MLDQVVNFFKIKINYDLSLMTENQSLNQLSEGFVEESKKATHSDLAIFTPLFVA